MTNARLLRLHGLSVVPVPLSTTPAGTDTAIETANIAFALGVKAVFLVLALSGYTSL